MKKRLMALLLAGCMVLGMTACGKDEGNNNPADAGNNISAENNKDNSGNQDENKEQVTLRFASWGLGTEEDNNLERQMIAAFEKSHQNIKIEIAEDVVGSGNWNEALATAAAGNNLPDVSFIAELPIAVANGWALDVSSLAAKDSEWSLVPSSLVESGKYNEKQYGLPTAMHLAGLFINTDYCDEMNVTPLKYGYTWDEFMNAVKALNKPSEGKVALKYVNDFVNFFPYLWDETQGWYTYDGNEMHLDSEAFIRAVKETNNLTNYAWLTLSEEQKAQSAGAEAGDYDAWRQGYTAMWYDASYCCEGYVRDLSYNVEFIGLPEGKSVIIPDYCFISSTTQHPEEAWEFVKYMFWGVEGINTRMDLDAADDGVTWASLPLSTADEIIDRYFKDYPISGLEETFRGMSNGTVVEAYKFAPGYSNARWNGMTGITIGDAEVNMAGIVDRCINGELSIDDYASQLNTLANSFIKAERAAIDKATK